MPATGIEPVPYRYDRILSPARLPVPPRRQIAFPREHEVFCASRDVVAVTFSHSQLSLQDYLSCENGTNRARTCDPLLVRQVLSQLSYDPRQTTPAGLEPATSAVTGRRSNQLSHEAVSYCLKDVPSKLHTVSFQTLSF